MQITKTGLHSKGFTLIELMIAIAVVAILVAMAVPAYRDYTIRSKIAECINGAAVAKIQVSEYQQALGAWPASDSHAGLDIPSGDSRFCIGFTNYQPGSGAFTVDIDETAISSSLGDVSPAFTPTALPNGIVNWRCSRGSTPSGNVKFLPASCRSTQVDEPDIN